MKTTDILNISLEQYNRMTKEELKPLLKQLQHTANQRLERLQSANISSPASKHPKFTMPLKATRNDLMRAFGDVRNFIMSETSTIRGSNSVTNAFMSRVGADARIRKERAKLEQELSRSKLSREEKAERRREFNRLQKLENYRMQSKFWSIVDKLKEKHPNILDTLGGSQSAHEHIADVVYGESMYGASQDAIIKEIEQQYSIGKQEIDNYNLRPEEDEEDDGSVEW